MGFSTRLHVAAILALGCAACPSSSSTDTQVCEEIGRNGGVVSSHDGVLSLSFRPSAVSEDTTVCISPAERPPNGPPFIYGEAYRVSPDIDLAVNLSVTYRFDLPSNTSQTAIGVVRRADWEAGQGRWLSLPITRLEPENKLVAGTDSRLSMFYGLLDDGGDGMVDPTVATTNPTSPSTSSPVTTNPTQTTEDTDQTDADTNNVDTESDTDESSSTGDPSTPTMTMSSTDPGSSSSSTGGESESESEAESEAESETGDFNCDNLPPGPIDTTMIADIENNNSEDLVMTGQGTFLVAAGAAMLEMDDEGNSTTWLDPLPFDEDMLGLGFDAYGTLYAAMGFASMDIYTLAPAGFEVYLASGINVANGVFVDTADRVWVTGFNSNAIFRIETTEPPTIQEVIGNNAGQANGIFFDENRGMIFWDRYGAARVHAAEVDAMGNVGPTQNIFEFDDGSLDGLTMDECGNLYVVDQAGPGAAPCRLIRLELDDAGQYVNDEVLASDGELGMNCANAKFGFGFDSDSDESLFITGNSGEIFRMNVSVAGYPIVLPPA